MALIGNKVIEKDLKDHLEREGTLKGSAKFSSIELVAVERPGWVQVFSFEVRGESQDGRLIRQHGVCRDDERYGQLEVELFDSAMARNTRLTELSTGLITAGTSGARLLPLVLCLFVAAGVLMVFVVLSRFF